MLLQVASEYSGGANSESRNIRKPDYYLSNEWDVCMERDHYRA